MEPERRRRNLTPLSGELKARDPWNEPAPRRRRFRRRRRPPPETLGGAIGLGLLRFALAVGVVAGLGIGVAALLGRSASIGLYVAGAVLLTVAFVSSTAVGAESPQYYATDEREQRVRASFVYAAAGLAVIALGVLVEIL